MARDDYMDDDFEEQEDDGDFEEFDEDFEAAGAAEQKVKCVSGMDTFAVVWSFFATLLALCILSWVILYEVYDDRLGGIFPEREKPLPQNKIKVLSFGRDADVTDTYNYAILATGKADGVVPGTYILLGDPKAPSTPKTFEEAWVVMCVTEECDAGICKAMIINVHTMAVGADANGQITVSASDLERRADSWEKIDNLTEAFDKLPLLLDLVQTGGGGEGGDVGEARVRCATASWNNQVLLKWVEEKFAKHTRKERKAAK
ncbi:MAG: hypothetical protein AB7K09_23070 [Planctomycetota bacterium]